VLVALVGADFGPGLQGLVLIERHRLPNAK
jgi:hypothetical protein